MMNLIGTLIFAFVFLAILTAGYAVMRRWPGDTDSVHEQQPAPVADNVPFESFFDRGERAAMQAGLGWSRTTYLAITGVAIAIGLVLIGLDNLNTGVIVMAAGVLLPAVYINHMQKKRAAMFIRQLPPALFMSASVLRAGGTLMQAVDAIAREMPDPIGAEFKLIQQQMRLQVPAHEAMAASQERVGVREFAAVVIAARITAEVGGNLAHIFDQISRSIVDAQNAQRTVNSFTTEGRMSANMITALPFVVLGLLHILSPGYFEPLFTTWPGRFVLAGCMGTIALGWYVIRRMVDIRMF